MERVPAWQSLVSEVHVLSGFPPWLPAALPGPGLPLACCLTCEPVSVCFVSLRTHSPALNP